MLLLIFFSLIFNVLPPIIFCTPLSKAASLTIVLVPGAFHVDSSFDILGAQLQQKGYNTRTWDLITVNKPQVSMDKDAEALADGILRPLIEEQGKNVVLYLHSYAGFPGSAAIARLSKAERAAKGQQGGIIGLIYQSAFIPQPGNTLLHMIGGTYAPWQAPDEKTGLITVIDPQKTFYADVSQILGTEAANQIYPQSLLSCNSPSGPVYYQDAAYNGRRVYLHTNQDQALPPFDQEMFVSHSGVAWKILKLDTSHSPFLSQPARVAGIIDENVKIFVASFKNGEITVT